MQARSIPLYSPCLSIYALHLLLLRYLMTLDLISGELISGKLALCFLLLGLFEDSSEWHQIDLATLLSLDEVDRWKQGRKHAQEHWEETTPSERGRFFLGDRGMSYSSFSLLLLHRPELDEP